MEEIAGLFLPVTTPLSLSRLPVSVLRYALGIAGALGALQLACAGAPPAPAPSAGPASAAAEISPPSLRPGVPVERELSGEGQDELLLDLQAGWYVRAVIEQKRLNVKAALLGPGGETLVSTDVPAGWTEPERLSLVTPSAGVYRLAVGLHDPKAAAGLYTVTIQELRPALAEDADRVAAERALTGIKLLRGEGRGEEAVAKARETRSLWQRIGDRPGEIDTLFEIGLLQTPGEAASTYAEARSLAAAAGDRRREAFSVRYLGECQLGGDPEQALRSFEEALAVWTELGDVGEQAEVWQAIGAAYIRQSSNDEARSAFQKVLALAQEAKAPLLEASAWNAIATIELAEGDGEKALEHAQNALRLAEELDSPNVKAVALTTLGSVYRRWGELPTAQKHFSEALAINRQLGKSAEVGRVLVHLLSVYQDLGEMERALRESNEALAIHRSAGDQGWETNTLLSIGQVYLKLGNPETALPSFESALAISLGRNPKQAGSALHFLGMARLALGQTAEAVEVLEKALPLRRESRDLHGEAFTLVELGGAYQKQGDLAKAEPALRHGLELARRMDAWNIEASALFGLARLGRERGDLAGALAEIRQAIAILESVRSELPDDRLRSSFFASKRSYYELYIDLLMRLEERSPGQGSASKALEVSEAARARSLLDLLGAGRLVTQGIAPELRRQEGELADRLSETQRALFREISREKPDEARIASLRETLSEIEDARSDLAWKIRQDHPRYAGLRYPSPLGFPEIQTRLDGDTALLEYALGEEGSYLFAVTREGLTVHRLPRAEEIRELVRKARNGLATSNRRNRSGYLRAASELYDELIAPALPALAGKRRLLIAPDGALHFLAFEALLTESPGDRKDADLPYLLRRFAVSYVPSASVLSLLALPDSPGETGGEAPKRFLAFADPVYASAGRPEDRALNPGGEEGRGLFDGLWSLPRLEGTRQEVSRIASRYPPAEVKIYEGAEANEENIKGNPLVETARRLHIAAHGLVDERQPELSGLFLTPKSPDDDGLLQVYEIFNLRLRADLVVLSACDTGLGKLVTGEGLVGLTRAFLYAGSPSVVVSLWRVRDDTAPDLMVGFYEDLDRLGDKAEALRQAKLAMIRKGEHAHPYHWAPFILVGSPR